MCNSRIINSQTTYITSAYPERSFYFANGILAGIVSNKYDLNAYKALLKFDFTDVEKCNIESAFLYLYINDRKCIEEVYNSNLIVTNNLDNFNIKKVNWYNQPKTNLDNAIKIIIRGENKKNYIKVDIRQFIDNGILKEGYLGLTIQGIAQCKTSLVKFSSCNTINRPYIEIKYNSICDDECYYEDDFDCDDEDDYDDDYHCEYDCRCGDKFDCDYGENYRCNNECRYNGSVYITNVNSPREYPDDSDDYSLIAEKGATESTGRGVLGITPFNLYNSAFYTLGQIVTYEGSTYIVTTSPPQGTPENSLDYMLLGAKEATGTNGIKET